MYDEKASDSDSSDSDGNEYYVVSKIKPSWLEDFQSGQFGGEFPTEKKMDAQKPIDVSKEFLNDILKKVRSKQNAKQPTQSVEAQNAISTIIGGNAPAKQQSNVQMNGAPSVAQMTAVPTQDFQPQNIPRPYRPLVNNPPGNFGFEPNPNILPTNHNVPIFNQQPPIPNAASAYYQTPAHMLMPNTNHFGHPIIQPILPQQTMPPQNGLPNSRFTQNVPQHHVHVQQPNMPYQNVPIPHTVLNIQRPIDPRIRPTDPRLHNRPPMQTPIIHNILPPPTLPLTLPLPPPPPPIVPMRPIRPILTPKKSLQKAASIDTNRRFNRISIDEYRRFDPRERAKARVEQTPDKNPVQQNGQVMASAENVQTNGADNEPEPTFSPTSITPASSPATEPSSGTPEPDENNQNDDVVENNDEVLVKKEVIEETQNDDCDSVASDATEEFTFENFKRDRELNMKELDEDAATDIVGNLSPQYIAEEEIESEEPEPTNESEEYYIIDDDVELIKESEDPSDSEELLVPVPERPVALIDQTKRCFIILEDIGHLIKKYDRTRKNKKKTKAKVKAKRGRRATRRFSSTTASDTEREQPKPAHVKQEFEPEPELEPEPEPEPEPPVQEVVPVVEQVIDEGVLSDIVISSEDENNDNNENRNYNGNDNNNNTNNNNAVNPIVYEISSDSDDE